jgi:NADH-quinone oxidoreductase subunit M
MTGAVFQAVSHGLVTTALFLTFGAVIDREGVGDFDSLGGLASRLPWVAFFLMVFSIASVALPLTSSFVGEFLIILGSWAAFPEWTLVAMLGVVLGAVYTLTAYLKTMFGEVRPSSEAGSRGDLGGSDVLVATALALSIFALGLFPQRLLTLIESSVSIQLQSGRELSARAADPSSEESEALDDTEPQGLAIPAGLEVSTEVEPSQDRSL